MNARSDVASFVIVAGVHLVTGPRLAMGSAVIEATAVPHLGRKKFATRFGLEAMKLVATRAAEGRGALLTVARPLAAG